MKAETKYCNFKAPIKFVIGSIFQSSSYLSKYEDEAEFSIEYLLYDDGFYKQIDSYGQIKSQIIRLFNIKIENINITYENDKIETNSFEELNNKIKYITIYLDRDIGDSFIKAKKRKIFIDNNFLD